MIREEAIKIMTNNPGVKFTHNYFSDDEYVYAKQNGYIYDENGYLFEDWISTDRDGMRLRNGGGWNENWDMIRDKETCRVMSKTKEGRDVICEDCNLKDSCEYIKDLKEA